MAIQQNSTALVPTDNDFRITVKEFDAAGKSTELITTLPTSSNFREWTTVQQVALLKKGIFAASPIHEILFAIAYANSLGLDILRGDIYSTGMGRLAISNKAKIKLALASGNIEGFETEITDTKQPINLEGCKQKTDLECKVTVHVKGWKTPIVRRARLSAWFNAKNPNWAGRPEHMLELNTLAHACEFVNPTATEDDEAPPLPQVNEAKVAVEQAKQQVEAEATTNQ